MTAADIRGPRLSLALGFVLLLFAAGVFVFAPAQNVWIDESTQLSGMTLPVGQLIPWLTGKLALPLGTPPDRMPPLSYLVDHMAWLVFGSTPIAFRLFHAAIVGGALLLLMTAMARRFNGRSALITGLVLALSPKFIELAVEIRAYPFFTAISCAQIALLLGGDVAAKPKRLALFVLLGLASAYTHYFGVVATSAYFVAVLADTRRWRDAIQAVLAYGVMALLWLGLIPFVTGATSISSATEVAQTGVGALAAYLFQLLGSAAQMVNPVAAALYFGGAALLVLLGVLGLLMLLGRERLEARYNVAFALALALAAGVSVTVLAGFAIKGFNALAPRYNLWALPLLALLIGVAADGLIGLPGKAARRARYGALALLAIGAIWAQAGFLGRAQWYIHGPSAALEETIAKAGDNKAVVYVATGSPTWSWGYFPLYWRHRATLPQWLLTADGAHVVRIGIGGDPNGAPQPLSALDSFSHLVVARIDLKTYKDLRAVVASGGAMAAPADLAPTLSQAGWQPAQAIARPGFYTLTGQIYGHRPTP
ncbi:MAG: glycosyltransferase family 39 protein [Sphingobium sp.]|nr:glycosyltransferase family 39 protein [Sphingobium sp.]